MLASYLLKSVNVCGLRLSPARITGHSYSYNCVGFALAQVKQLAKQNHVKTVKMYSWCLRSIGGIRLKRGDISPRRSSSSQGTDKGRGCAEKTRQGIACKYARRRRGCRYVWVEVDVWRREVSLSVDRNTVGGAGTGGLMTSRAVASCLPTERRQRSTSGKDGGRRKLLEESQLE